MAMLTYLGKVENVLMGRTGDGAMLTKMPATKETYMMANSFLPHRANLKLKSLKLILTSHVPAMENLTNMVMVGLVMMMITVLLIKMPTVQISNHTMEKLSQKLLVKVKKTYSIYFRVQHKNLS